GRGARRVAGQAEVNERGGRLRGPRRSGPHGLGAALGGGSPGVAGIPDFWRAMAEPAAGNSLGGTLGTAAPASARASAGSPKAAAESGARAGRGQAGTRHPQTRNRREKGGEGKTSAQTRAGTQGRAQAHPQIRRQG